MNGKYSAGEKPPKTLSNLWEFALAAYSEPIIQRHCLYLQDHYQMDVNMLLAAGFCGRQNLCWTESLCCELTALVAPIRETLVLPLRVLRREAEGRPRLYEALKAAELEAERSQVEILASRLATLTTANDVDANYLAKLLAYAAVCTDAKQGQFLLKCQGLATEFAKLR